jgi:hypothetical protein
MVILASGAGIDPDRPAIHRERPPAVPVLAAGVIRRRPSGARPPLPKNLRGAARFWLVMILLLVVAPFLGLGAAGGSGSYVGQINDAARKLFEPAHAAGLTALVGAVSLLGSVWTLGICGWRPAPCWSCSGGGSTCWPSPARCWWWGGSFTRPPRRDAGDTPAHGCGRGGRRAGPVRGRGGLAVTVVGMAYALVPPGRARRLALAGGGVLLAALGAARLSGGWDLSGV